MKRVYKWDKKINKLIEVKKEWKGWECYEVIGFTILNYRLEENDGYDKEEIWLERK